MKLHWVEWTSHALVIVGALLWLIYGITAFTGTAFLLTGWFWNVIYILVGLSGVGALISLIRVAMK